MEDLKTVAVSGGPPAWSMKPLTRQQLLQMPGRISFPAAARSLGYRRWRAYRAVKEGTWPVEVPIIEGVSKGWLVETSALLRYLWPAECGQREG